MFLFLEIIIVEENGGDDVGVIVGGIIGGLLGLILIVLIVLFVLRRIKPDKMKNVQNSVLEKVGMKTSSKTTTKKGKTNIISRQNLNDFFNNSFAHTYKLVYMSCCFRFTWFE